mgnify:FL=1|jgi:sialate O-acetylesterase
MKRFVHYGVLFLALLSGTASAKIVLPPMFSDHMVLQQQTVAPVWGETKPEKKVKLTSSWDNRQYVTKADKNGKWRIDIQTPAAGGPYRLTISDGETLVLNNVMVGEVWLCSGQSNMEMPFIGWGKPDNYEQEIAAADHPEIRLFHVEHVTSSQPRSDIKVRNNSWQVCSPATIPEFSTTAYFFGRELAKKLNVPVGLIHSSWGGTDIEPWISGEFLRKLPAFAEKVDSIASLPLTEEVSPHTGTAIYNAMIHPLIPYRFHGAIWYQGENNVRRAYQYRDLFPLLITNWRQDWGMDFPFYFVQLAAFTPMLAEPAESEWAELREAQTRALTLKNTGMAVIIDKGDAADIHPKDKQTVGKRLSLIARAQTYGETSLPYSGPMYRSYRIEGNKMILSFDHVDGGLKIGFGESEASVKETGERNELKGFAIASYDHKFHWATARIEGDCVVVSSPEVPFPVAVRYAWANNPDCNLYNGAGLPASPFRTDDWKGCTRND